MTADNAKHPYEPDWQIPRGVWANSFILMIFMPLGYNLGSARLRVYASHTSSSF